MLALLTPIMTAALMSQFQGGPLKSEVVDDQGKPVEGAQVVFDAPAPWGSRVQPVEVRAMTRRKVGSGSLRRRFEGFTFAVLEFGLLAPAWRSPPSPDSEHLGPWSCTRPGRGPSRSKGPTVDPSRVRAFRRESSRSGAPPPKYLAR